MVAVSFTVSVLEKVNSLSRVMLLTGTSIVVLVAVKLFVPVVTVPVA